MNKPRWTRSQHHHATTGHRSLAIYLDGDRVATGFWRPGTYRQQAEAVVDTLIRNANAFDGLVESLVDALALLRWYVYEEGNKSHSPTEAFAKGVIESATKTLQAIPANGDHFHFWSLPGENDERTCLFCDEVWTNE